MKGWFEASGLDRVVNNDSSCGRKRHHSKREAERIEKAARKTPSKKSRYKCDMCGDYHMTSRKK